MDKVSFIGSSSANFFGWKGGKDCLKPFINEVFPLHFDKDPKTSLEALVNFTSPVLVSGRDNTDAEIGLYAILDPALIYSWKRFHVLRQQIWLQGPFPHHEF